MYFSGHVAVDPSDITDIVKNKPTKGFLRFARAIAHNVEGRTAERETFAAVSILQRVNMALRSLGVTNILHLSCDGEVIYDDRDGVDDDFRDALIAFGRHADTDQKHNFEVLTLTLEHVGELLKFLVEVEILRTHAVGSPPIEIRVNGVFREFEGNAGELTDETTTRFDELMGDQEWYDAVQLAGEKEFRLFLDDLENTCREHLNADRVTRDHHTKILEPGAAGRRASRSGYSDPLFYDGYHWEQERVYIWHWSGYCHRHDCALHHCLVVDENGDVLTEYDSDAVVGSYDAPAADEEDALDTELPVEESSHEEECEGVESELGTEYASEESPISTDDSSGGGGWLASLFGGFGDGGSWGDGDGGDGGGGCGGCGGGCGG